MGGSRVAAQSSIAGRTTAGRLATFLVAAQREGLAAAARSVDLQAFLNGSAELFLVSLADVLAPSGGLTEEAVAREALDATLAELYDELADGSTGLDALESLTSSALSETLLRYSINYIYGRVINALAAHIHATATSVSRVRDVEILARNYIEEAVRLDLDVTGALRVGASPSPAPLTNAALQKMVDALFVECYEVVSAGLPQGAKAVQ